MINFNRSFSLINRNYLTRRINNYNFINHSTTLKCLYNNNSNNISINRLYCTISNPPYRVLFFGTDDVSFQTLKLLNENNKIKKNEHDNSFQVTSSTTDGVKNIPLVVDELEVICPDNPSEEVYQYAQANNIPMHHPDKVNGMKGFKAPVSSKSNLPFDVAVVVSFGYFIPKSVLSTFKYGGINMHPSLLPRHRGAAPIYYTLLSGDKETGISIIKLDPKKFDVGDILLQTRMPIKQDKLYLEFRKQLASDGASAVMYTLSKFKDFTENAKSQAQDGATAAPKVNKSQSRIDWNKDGVNTIWNKYRAFSDNFGLSTTIYSKKFKTWKVLKITEMIPPFNIELDSSPHGEISKIYQELNQDLKQLNGNEPCGTYFLGSANKLMWIKCSDGWIGVSKLYEDGKKKPVKAHEFLFGKLVLSPTNSSDSAGIQIPSNQVVV